VPEGANPEQIGGVVSFGAEIGGDAG